MTTPDQGDGVRAVLVAASAAARLVGAAETDPAHLLIGLCDVCDADDPRPHAGHDGVGEIAELRDRFADGALDPSALRRRIRRRTGARGRGDPSGTPVPPGEHTRRVLARAATLAAGERAGTVTPVHLLRAVLEDPHPDWAVPAAQLGVDDLLSACFPAPPAGAGSSPPSVVLEMTTGSTAGRAWTATEPTRWVIGRSVADCTIVVPEEEDRLVSRCHALVEADPPRVHVCDLGSRNGTSVNGEVLPASTDPRDRDPSGRGINGPHRELSDGDRVQLGDTVLRVTLRESDRCGGCGAVRDPEETRVAGRCSACEPGSAGAAVRSDAYAAVATRPRCPVCADPVDGSGIGPDGERQLCGPCGRDPDRIVDMIGRRVERGEHLPGLFGGYTVLGVVGVGGMGQVYRARDEQTDDLVCIKVILPSQNAPEVATNFRREADNGRQLRHRNILRQREHGQWFGALYLVTDFCGGGDLYSVLDHSGGRLDPARAVRIAVQALDGLHHAHEAHVTTVLADGRRAPSRGVVHRDISPGNLLFSGDTVKVGDFGLSKAFAQAGSSGLTRIGTAAGKPSYMSRRQINDYKFVGPEVDVWAVAACLYYMLTGTTPRDFEGRPVPIQVILYDDVVPVRDREPSIPAALAHVVDRTLAEDGPPAYRTARELRVALEEAVRAG